MCQPKPGPRCSSHTKTRLDTARLDYEMAKRSGDTEEILIKKLKFAKAILDYDASPAGLSALRDKIEADEYLGDVEEKKILKKRYVRALTTRNRQLRAAQSLQAA